MTTEIRITFEGTTPGVADHRLSLSLFADALGYLASALQRTASAELSQSDEAKTRGNIAAPAKLLDLELLAVEDNCVSVRMEAVSREYFGPQTAANQELAARASLRLLEEIEAEATGSEQSPVARKFLQYLPEGLSSQKYRLTRDGETIKEFSVGSIQALKPRKHPRVTLLRGQIVAVGFPPGTTSFAMRSGDRRVTIGIEPSQVDDVLALRGGVVRVAARVSGSDSNLLWIRRDDDARNAVPLEVETVHALAIRDFSKTLQRLGE